ncbi:MAG: cache domain-containing protein [Caldilineaceae bacterium]
MDQAPDVIAIYYMDPSGATRYYPKVEIVDVVDHRLIVTEHDFFRLATPDEDPQRQPVWTSPYIDYIGHGPVVTVATPVYVEDEFVGVISVDVSLTRLIDRLNRLTPTPGSCAFAHRRRRAGWWRPRLGCTR